MLMGTVSGITTGTGTDHDGIIMMENGYALHLAADSNYDPPGLTVSGSGTNSYVGICKTNPTGSLHVNTTSDGDISLNMGVGGTTSGVIVTDANLFINASYNGGQGGSGVIALGMGRQNWSGGTEVMRLLESGNVGIGCTDPSPSTGDGLEVRHASRANIELHATGSNSLSTIVFKNDADEWHVNGPVGSAGDAFQIWNGSVKMSIATSGATTFYDALTAGSLTSNGGITASGEISANANADSTHYLGRCRFSSPFSGYAAFSHYSMTANNNYAFMQHSSGITYVNSAPNQTLYLRSGNSDLATLATGGWTIGANLTYGKMSYSTSLGSGSRKGVKIDGEWDSLHIQGRVIDWTNNNLHIGYGGTAPAGKKVIFDNYDVLIREDLEVTGDIISTDIRMKNDKGDFTLFEEEEYICVRNNKTEKLYKLVMEEITND